ncbi:MAG: hypothetical protein P8Z36_01835 [Gemmatimonadota bacterium]|jgi:hypothetical protein
MMQENEPAGRPPPLHPEERIRDMLGMVGNVLNDGKISQGELLALASWLGANSDLLEEWPANAIAHHVGHALSDGRIAEVERRKLAELLRELMELYNTPGST